MASGEGEGNIRVRNAKCTIDYSDQGRPCSGLGSKAVTSVPAHVLVSETGETTDEHDDCSIVIVSGLEHIRRRDSTPNYSRNVTANAFKS